MSWFWGSSKEPEKEQQDPSIPKPCPYQCPFPFTGGTVEDKGTIYTLACKADALAFRHFVDDIDDFNLRYSSETLITWDKKIPGESFNLMKVCMVMNHPSSMMWDFLHDPVHRLTWDDGRLYGERLALLDNVNDLQSYGVAGVLGVANRHFVYHRAWHNAGDGEYVILNTAAVHNDCPEKSGEVRAITKISGYLLTPMPGDPTKTFLIFVVLTDPKGWLPPMFVNYLTTKFAPGMMDKMQKAAAGYDEWRASLGEGKWQKDWQLEPDPWGVPVENKTLQFFLANQAKMRQQK